MFSPLNRPWWYGYTPRRILQRWFPKRYVQWKLTGLRQEQGEQLKVAKATPGTDIQGLENDLYWDPRELEDWLDEIDSRKLVRKANKGTSILDTTIGGLLSWRR